jgi:hypothetical protein
MGQCWKCFYSWEDFKWNFWKSNSLHDTWDMTQINQSIFFIQFQKTFQVQDSFYYENWIKSIETFLLELLSLKMETPGRGKSFFLCYCYINQFVISWLSPFDLLCLDDPKFVENTPSIGKLHTFILAQILGTFCSKIKTFNFQTIGVQHNFKHLL